MNYPYPISCISDLTITHKKVLVRVDLDISTSEFQAGEDYKLQSLKETLNYLRKHNNTIILAGHRKKEALASTRAFLPWLEKEGYTIDFACDIVQAKEKITSTTCNIILLENLLLLPGEATLDAHFARNLADLADFYVNEAFNLIAENYTSMVIVPTLFDAGAKAVGFSFVHELELLKTLQPHAQKPITLVLGGELSGHSLEVATRFFHTMPLTPPPTIMLGGSLAHPFLKALGISIGNAPLEETTLMKVRGLVMHARAHGISLLVPLDHTIMPTLNAPLLSTAAIIPYNHRGIDIGSATQKRYCTALQNAETIILAGTMGQWKEENASQGTQKLLEQCASSKAFIIASGSETQAALAHYNLAHKIIHHSSAEFTLPLLLHGSVQTLFNLPALQALRVS